MLLDRIGARVLAMGSCSPPPGGAALFLGARAALESGRRENGTGWIIRSLREFQVGLVNNDNRINFRG